MVEGNIISQAATGISVSAGSTAEVIGNTVEDVTVGISVSDADPVIRDNQLRRHTTGLLLIASAAQVDGNLIEDGQNGIVLSGPSTDPTLIGNTICGHEDDVKAAAGAPEPDLGGNDLCGDLAVAE
jgi:nitrous oxidase accessory protein NosD